MNFNEAMKAIKAGKKVRRRSWGSAFRPAGICDKDLDQYFMIVKPCADEFLSEDWYIVEEKTGYLSSTFHKVDGKKRCII